jgi:hypothetical protein
LRNHDRVLEGSRGVESRSKIVDARLELCFRASMSF